ncbi:MAG: restriction endonuclease subunit S [Lewinellaceae bacterium]|nr:restriction endonuclease subunit S [Lewinellaceae bacterium]
MEIISNDFEVISKAPEQIRKLKELVLNLAVTGRLLPQNSDWGNASSILNSIKQKKAALISEKIIVKEKPQPSIDYDEIYFNLPQSWEWCRLIDLCKYIQRGKSPTYIEDSKIPIISQKCVQWDGFQIDRARFLNPLVLPQYGPERFLETGDLLWNSTGHGTLGRIIVFYEKYNPFEKTVADSHVTVIRPFKEKILPEYLFYWFASPFVQEEINDKATGTTKQLELNTSTVKSYLVPLPPTEEQHRIVQKVTHLFRQIDALAEGAEQAERVRQRLRAALLHRLEQAPGPAAAGQAWGPLDHQFALAIRRVEDVQALRQTILQLAVKGLLVKQDPGDEPASVLLERIRKEKARLVKEGRIRKQPALPPVKEEEVPFEVPEGWVWCRLGEVVVDISSGWSPKCYSFPAKVGEWGVLKVSAVSWDVFKPEENKRLPENMSPKKEIEVKKGDYLMSRANTEELVAKSVIVHQDVQMLMMSDKILRVSFSEEISKEFIKIVNNGVLGREFFAEKATGTSMSMKNVSRDIIKRMPIPLPPLAEQRRIVERVERLLGWCARLEAGIRDLEEKGEQVVRVGVRNSV